MFEIEYEYYDARKHKLTKHITCGNIDRVKVHCMNIYKLEKHRPISNPTIWYSEDGIVKSRYSFNSLLKEALKDEKYN